MKSTVVPGTTDSTVLPILERSSGKKAGPDFGVGMNPEFLTEGEAVSDFMNPDRIVLGGMDEKTIACLDRLYCGFEGVDKLQHEFQDRGNDQIRVQRASRDHDFLLQRNLLIWAPLLGGIDIVDVMRGVHLSNYLSVRLPDGSGKGPGITSGFLAAGCGFGGSCLPKDVKALVAHGRKVGVPMNLLDSVVKINEQQPQKVISLLKKHHPSLRGVRVAVLGLSFRPDTNDMRESPAIPILRALASEGAHLKRTIRRRGKKLARFFGAIRCAFVMNLRRQSPTRKLLCW